jgi:hypothetical protein
LLIIERSDITWQDAADAVVSALDVKGVALLVQQDALPVVVKDAQFVLVHALLVVLLLELQLLLK